MERILRAVVGRLGKCSLLSFQNAGGWMAGAGWMNHVRTMVRRDGCVGSILVMSSTAAAMFTAVCA